MRTLSLWLFIFTFTASLARAQDAATQQQLDQINGRIQNLIDMQAVQGKRLDALEKQISDLQDKLNQPGGSDFASVDDLKKLSGQVKDLAQKQQDDNQQILKALEKLDKAMGVAPSGRKPAPAASNDNSTPAGSGAQKGYYYEVKSGDTLSAIAKAYSAELKTKVTVEQIQAANPGLNPKNMTVGKKIFIPQPQ